MHLHKTSLRDAYLIKLAPRADARGSFCRLFCAQILRDEGIVDHTFVQVNLSENSVRGTLRGLHFQASPHFEAKVVYCLRGAVFDVIVDLRRDSPTYLRYFAYELSAEEGVALYVPKGYAHGFLTLEDDSTLLYLMSDFYRPGCERGYRFDDPAFGIAWPFAPRVISEKDQYYPAFESAHVSC